LTEKKHSKKTYLSITSYIISKLNIAKRCISYIFLSVRPSVRLAHIGTVPRRRKRGSLGLKQTKHIYYNECIFAQVRPMLNIIQDKHEASYYRFLHNLMPMLLK